MTARAAVTDDLLARIDAELADQERNQAEAVALVADNPWCMKALGRRGIVATPA